MLNRSTPNCMSRVAIPSSLFQFVRQIILLVAPFVIASAAFTQTTFLPVPSTPYDRQMLRVQPFVSCKAGTLAHASAIPLPITVWMVELRAVPYHYSRHWQTPAELRLAQEGDCKAKSLALYAEMREGGAQNLRIVIGKRHIFDATTHSWVQWDTSDGSFVLDPTFNESPMRAALLDSSTYVAFYAFDGEHKYRATNPTLTANASPIVKPQIQSAPTPATGSYRPANTNMTPATKPLTLTAPLTNAPATTSPIQPLCVRQQPRSTSAVAPKSYVTAAPAAVTNSSSELYTKTASATASPVAAAPLLAKTPAHKSSSSKPHTTHRRHHRHHAHAKASDD